MADRAIHIVVLLGVLLAPVRVALGEPAGGKAMERCVQAAAAHEHLQAEVGAMDAELERKAGAMNAATGDAKVQAMADLLTSLVSQRRTLDAETARVHAAMMGDCPSLQGSAARPEAGTDAASGVGRPR